MYSEGQLIPVPDTKLTAFLFDAEHNTKCSLSINVNGMKLIHEIDALFLPCNNSLASPNYPLFPVFSSRCHGAYRGAVRLLLGGQATETYALLRLAIENALYAVYTGDNERAELWAQRGNSPKHAKQIRHDFTVGKMRECLARIDSQLAASVNQLYEMSIDFGAHPNVDGHVASSELTESEVTSDFLAPGTLFWKNTVQRLVRCGSVCLKVLSATPQSRFDLGTRTGINELYDLTGAFKEFKSEVAQAEACGSGS